MQPCGTNEVHGTLPFNCKPTANLRLAVALAKSLAVLFVCTMHLQAAAPTVIYSTGFETTEGYSTGFVLAGQQNWVSAGSGGNGILNGFFPGMGQQAYVGFGAPSSTDDLLNLWRPLNLAPVPTNQPVVKFSVTMSVIGSTNDHHDDFRWSVYNTNGARLFTLDFDGAALAITYALDDGQGFVATGWNFARDTIYDLVVTMNFARNRWSATLNGTQVAASLPISTAGAALNLGDVDAVWAIRTPTSPGNNYLIFDDYRLTTEDVAVSRPMVSSVAALGDGRLQLRLQGEQTVRYAIEGTTNLAQWVSLTTNSAATGVIDFTDSTAPGLSRRFYRARQVP